MGLQSWYDRNILPKVLCAACGQDGITRLRAVVVPHARGRVFEMGCGGGLNQGWYDPSCVTLLAGIDPHPLLLEEARLRASVSGILTDMREGRGEAIPFADGSFDTVVCTYTLCSVDNPRAVMAEMRRILRPGGQLLFLEHGRAPDRGVAAWQERLEPVWKRIAGGCHLTRPVGSALRGAGFSVEPFGQAYLEKTPRVLGWMEWGIARKEGV